MVGCSHTKKVRFAIDLPWFHMISPGKMRSSTSLNWHQNWGSDGISETQIWSERFPSMANSPAMAPAAKCPTRIIFLIFFASAFLSWNKREIGKSDFLETLDRPCFFFWGNYRGSCRFSIIDIYRPILGLVDHPWSSMIIRITKWTSTAGCIHLKWSGKSWWHGMKTSPIQGVLESRRESLPMVRWPRFLYFSICLLTWKTPNAKVSPAKLGDWTDLNSGLLETIVPLRLKNPAACSRILAEHLVMAFILIFFVTDLRAMFLWLLLVITRCYWPVSDQGLATMLPRYWTHSVTKEVQNGSLSLSLFSLSASKCLPTEVKKTRPALFPLYIAVRQNTYTSAEPLSKTNMELPLSPHINKCNRGSNRRYVHLTGSQTNWKGKPAIPFQ